MFLGLTSLFICFNNIFLCLILQNIYSSKTRVRRYGHYDSYVDQREQYLELLAELDQIYVPHYSYDSERRNELSQWLFKLSYAEVKRRRKGRLWSKVYDVESGKHMLGDSDFQQYLKDEENRGLNMEQGASGVQEEVQVESNYSKMLRINEERRIRDEAERKKIEARVNRCDIDEQGDKIFKNILKSNAERKERDDAEWKKYVVKYKSGAVVEDQEICEKVIALRDLAVREEREQIAWSVDTEEEKQMFVDAVEQFDEHVAAGWEPSDSEGEKEGEQFGCKPKKRRTAEEQRLHDVCFEKDWNDNEEAERIRAERLHRRSIMIDADDIQFARSAKSVIVEKKVKETVQKKQQSPVKEAVQVAESMTDRALSPIEVIQETSRGGPSRSEDLRLKSFYEQQMEDIIKEMKDKLVLEDIRKRKQFEDQLKEQLMSETAEFKEQYRKDVIDELRRQSDDRKVEAEHRRAMENQRDEEHEQRERLRRRGAAGRSIVWREVVDYESNITDSMTENQINQREGKNMI